MKSREQEGDISPALLSQASEDSSNDNIPGQARTQPEHLSPPVVTLIGTKESSEDKENRRPMTESQPHSECSFWFPLKCHQGQRIWQRDFPGIYTTINAHQWSETVQPIMEALKDATRRRAFALVSQAYTSIIADDFAAFVGLPVEEAVKGVLEQGWQADSATRMVLPRKPASGALDVSFNRFIPLSEPAPVPPIPNEQQLARLTDYVAFLEN
ncbi:COP9 signalosome complex subunit 8 [Microtus ochrogaster]|uniref:COP9 signalosome complex subunit 8 n=1 Tax=Microtus ochrogaster TaxID=79684 RepID=A0A8J6KZL9_MICOH|nr:COP9 signalosome complex subunit 8 [Microtus ochrogaster]